jgi:hypothetical protein
VTERIDTRSRSRRWATRLVVASLVCQLFSGNTDQLGLPVPPDRVLLLAAIAVLVLGDAAQGLRRLRWRTVHTLLVLTIVWAVESALGAGTLQTAYGFWALLDRLVIPTILFVLAPVLFSDPHDRRLLSRTLVLVGLYLGVTAVFEVLGPTALVFPRYIMNPDVGILFGRARGPFAGAEPDGMVMAACLFVAAHLVPRSRAGWRIASALCVLACSVGILLTLTRSVWIGTLVGLAVVVVLLPRRRQLLLTIAVAGAALFVLVVSVPGLSTTLDDRLSTQRSVYDRQNTDAAALRVIAEHPLDGIGWMTFIDQSGDWVRQADTYPVTNTHIEIHNVVLSRAAELGLPGALLWVSAVMAGPGLAAVNRPRDADLRGWRLVFVGYASVWGTCIMLSPVPYPMVNNLLWLLAGMVLRDRLTRRSAPLRPVPVLAR